jgi:1,4-dihydroxy-2-naphthoate octaprenyltransferase
LRFIDVKFLFFTFYFAGMRRSTIQLLRFHFSLFLLPVYLFALSLLPSVNWYRASLVFFILHFLVYPSSNGYNSYMDRDSTPIGGLSDPMQPTRELFYTTIAMDISALALACLLDRYFAAAILLYIVASRAYSYRGIRLKKYPFAGYATVVVFQGAWVFILSWHGCSSDLNWQIPLFPLLAASCLIGGYYPLTQVYQHAEDAKDGVKTISMWLGVRNTFVFCGIIFVLATICMYLTFYKKGQLGSFFIFTACLLPMVLFFVQWMLKVWKDEKNADFSNSLRMNILASCCTAICFIILIVLK